MADKFFEFWQKNHALFNTEQWGRRREVSLYKEVDIADSRKVRIRINWAAIGSVSKAEAEKFRDCLMKAFLRGNQVAHELREFGFIVEWETEEGK